MKNKSKMIINESGNKKWYLNDLLHREDGPAIKQTNEYKAWYLNGKLHRINGPAVKCANGNKYWYLNGNFHRIDGPAIENSDGTKEWYLNGEEVKEEDVINYNITEREYIEFVINL